MLSERDVLIWQQHQKDLLREAERNRILHQAFAQKQKMHLHHLVLRWLGGYFVAWGCYLQRRYAFGAVGTDGIASLDSQSAPDCGCAS